MPSTAPGPLPYPVGEFPRRSEPDGKTPVFSSAALLLRHDRYVHANGLLPLSRTDSRRTSRCERWHPFAHGHGHAMQILPRPDRTIDSGGGTSAWAALVNPLRSEVHLFVNEYVITNRSAAYPAEAQLWFGKAASLGNPTVSQFVTPGFVQLSPCPQPQGQIVYDTGPLPMNGTASATRVVSPSSSVAAEKTGHWILGPGTALLFYFPGEGEAVDLIVSLGWWEQPMYR